MINVENLKFTYPQGDAQTLKGLNFEIKEGEIFGFLGPSGAGKSTAQKILYKLLTGYEGKVLIDGKDLNSWDKSYFEKIGVGFELPNHYMKLTGRENLKLFASFYSKACLPVEQLFEMVELSEAMDKKVEEYSKGMKMRLNFIRAIQHQADILFFDEPTSGLDPVNALKIKQHILDLKKQGKTIFVTTHSMETADQICDRVAFLVDGEIKACDPPNKLKSLYGQEAVRVELIDGKQEVFELKNIGNNPTFLDFIQSSEVKKMNSLDASLEEVFMQVTGKALRQ